MEIKRLFKGIAVIVDNEIEDKDSAIYKIKTLIEAQNIPVAVFSEIPQLEVIPSLASTSFIILDWDYTNSKLDAGEGERVSIPAELMETEEERLIEFIKRLQSDTFAPIFIFTAKHSQTVVDRLKAWVPERPVPGSSGRTP